MRRYNKMVLPPHDLKESYVMLSIYDYVQRAVYQEPKYALETHKYPGASLSRLKSR